MPNLFIPVEWWFIPLCTWWSSNRLEEQWTKQHLSTDWHGGLAAHGEVVMRESASALLFADPL